VVRHPLLALVVTDLAPVFTTCVISVIVVRRPPPSIHSWCQSSLALRRHKNGCLCGSGSALSLERG
jgi:hypothetical protein